MMKTLFKPCSTIAYGCLILSAGLCHLGCGDTQPNPAKASSLTPLKQKKTHNNHANHQRQKSDLHQHPEDIKATTNLQNWPRETPNALLQQATKHFHRDHLLNPNLARMTVFRNSELPYQNITPLPVETLTLPDAERLYDQGQWQFIDVRKDDDYSETGTIPSAIHLEYQFQNASYTGKTELTGPRIKAILKEKKGVIFFCNGPKCSRSFNAAIAAVYHWGIPADRVKWFRRGAPSWDMHLLVKPDKP